MFDAVDYNHDTWKMALSRFVDFDLVSYVDATRSLKYLSSDLHCRAVYKFQFHNKAVIATLTVSE